MDIIALAFLIAGAVINNKGLLTAAIVISSVCTVIDLITSVASKDDKEMSFKATLGEVIAATILTLSIIFMKIL